MAEHTIPVDLFNPGQVFACLGLLEAAELLLGDAEGGFDWSDDTNVLFTLRANGEENPVKEVLDFLAKASVIVTCPAGIDGPWPTDAVPTETFRAPLDALRKSDGKGFTASSLPIQLQRGHHVVTISHWLKGDGLSPFKLFAGQQVGAQLAANMLYRDASKRGSEGFIHLFPAISEKKFNDPFGEVCGVGGRFGFDARGSWDALRIGTSLDQQGTLVRVAPHVEILAAIGLENTRPVSLGTHDMRYAAWQPIMPVVLCRVAFGGGEVCLPQNELRFFRGHLGDDQQYKKCFFAEREQ